MREYQHEPNPCFSVVWAVIIAILMTLLGCSKNARPSSNHSDNPSQTNGSPVVSNEGSTNSNSPPVDLNRNTNGGNDNSALHLSANSTDREPEGQKPPESDAPPTIDSILSNMRQASDQLHTLQAGISVESRNLQISSRPERSAGKVFVKHVADYSEQDAARIDYVGPPAKQVLLKNDRMEMYEPGINQVTRASRNTAEDQVTKTYPVLAYNATTTYFGAEKSGNRSWYVIQITPKEQGNIKSARVWVNRRTWFPEKFQVLYTASEQTITLSNMIVNGSIPDSVFTLTYPATVTVVNH